MPAKQKSLDPNIMSQFTGSEHWYRFGIVPDITCTDGAKYVADTAGAYWLLDEIAIAQKYVKQVAAEEFQVWKLTVKPDSSAIPRLRGALEVLSPCRSRRPDRGLNRRPDPRQRGGSLAFSQIGSATVVRQQFFGMIYGLNLDEKFGTSWLETAGPVLRCDHDRIGMASLQCRSWTASVMQRFALSRDDRSERAKTVRSVERRLQTGRHLPAATGVP
jgi:hypothetical protein